MAEAGQDEENEEKPLEASQRKLDEARRKGDVPHSADLTTAAAYGGALACAVALGAPILNDMAEVMQAMFAHADSFGQSVMTGPSQPFLSAVADGIGLSAAAMFLIPAGAALLAVLVQRSLVFAPTKIAPKLNRISLIKGAQNKFGANGLFEFLKSALKLTIFSVVLGVFVVSRMDAMLASLALDPRHVTVLMMRLAVEFLAIVFVVLLIFGGIDILWQRARYAKRQRMSRKEMADEMKQNEGDPYLKARRRDRAMELATNRMLADVPGASVVITNPTHYAVALTWDRALGGAPVCVAKGGDEIAMRIREVAMEAGVPIHHDPPTTRALFATVEIGSEIPPDHYRAVALAIRFAENIRARAGGRRDG
ncbi:MAG: flagellar type III secretion system protein FlhB [Pseudomonadota bacterium]